MFPPGQQRGSEQVCRVNAGREGNSLPTGILTRPHAQAIVFSKEAFHHGVLRKAHRFEHGPGTAPDVLQERGDLVCAGKLVSRNAELSEGSGSACCAGEADFVLTRIPRQAVYSRGDPALLGMVLPLRSGDFTTHHLTA
jgi:hypothetical protein